MGYSPPREYTSDPKVVNPKVDTLSQAIAKLGGLDRAEAESEGIDPANFRDRTINQPIAGINRPMFRKTKGYRGGRRNRRLERAPCRPGHLCAAHQG